MKKPSKKKGPKWTPKEDVKLRAYVRINGEGRWKDVALNLGIEKNANSCRSRYVNHLSPTLKTGALTNKEKLQILCLHAELGNKWSEIASHLPGRTDNAIKNFCNAYNKEQLSAAGGGGGVVIGEYFSVCGVDFVVREMSCIGGVEVVVGESPSS